MASHLLSVSIHERLVKLKTQEPAGLPLVAKKRTEAPVTGLTASQPQYKRVGLAVMDSFNHFNALRSYALRLDRPTYSHPTPWRRLYIEVAPPCAVLPLQKASHASLNSYNPRDPKMDKPDGSNEVNGTNIASRLPKGSEPLCAQSSLRAELRRLPMPKITRISNQGPGSRCGRPRRSNEMKMACLMLAESQTRGLFHPVTILNVVSIKGRRSPNPFTLIWLVKSYGNLRTGMEMGQTVDGKQSVANVLVQAQDGK